MVRKYKKGASSSIFGDGISNYNELREHRALSKKYPNLNRNQIIRLRGREFG